MHLVEHHNDLFSWKKYNSYVHADNSVVRKEHFKKEQCRLNVTMKCTHVKYNVLTLMTVGLL
jgi:hypothetical protein